MILSKSSWGIWDRLSSVKWAPVKQKTDEFNWINIALHYRAPVKQKKILFSQGKLDKNFIPVRSSGLFRYIIGDLPQYHLPELPQRNRLRPDEIGVAFHWASIPQGGTGGASPS